MKARIFAICFFVLSMFSSYCNVQDVQNLPFDESFKNQLLKNKVAGAGYAVFNANSIVWSGSFGTYDSLKNFAG